MNIKRINELDYINNPEGYYGICSDGDGNTKRYKISISEGGEGGNQDKLDKLVNITYSELVNLRDNGELIPGQQYRITDYMTTTIQSDTQSAGHQFDIIVTADDINVLNENARAIQHEGDTYFSNSDLNAWELKYCLDNDKSRFTWTEPETYVEIRLEVDDFFKNIIEYCFAIPISRIPGVLKFSWWDNPRNGTDRYGDVYSCVNLQLPADDFMCLVYPLGTDVIANPELCYPNICINGQPTEITLEYDNDGDGIIDKKYIPTSIEFSINGKGVIYYMKDEWNNECPYDFKNIQFARWELPNPVSESPTYCYTFGKDIDYSISGINYGNVIKEYYNSNNKIQLNNIVFLGNNCSYNSFSNDCYDNTFGNGCYSNSFGNSFRYNIFGNNCDSNSFGNNCDSNSFGNSFRYNIFGNGCHNNSFGNGFQDNNLGNYCFENIFGNHCYRNSFGNNCYRNSFGNNCYSNSFGNSCSDNSFGESKDNLKSYYRYIIFDNGNQCINLNCTSTTSSTNYYQNVRIGLGVNDTYTYKTINDSNVGQTYQTSYKPADSKDLTA